MRTRAALAFLPLLACRCGGGPKDPLDRLLADLRREAPRMRAFRMEFEEEKRLPDLGAPVTVRGTLSGKAEPDGVWLRLEAREPHASSVLVSPAEVRIYTPRERQMERADLDGAPAFAGLFRGIFLFYAADREGLERRYALTWEAPQEGKAVRANVVEIAPRGEAWEGIRGPLRLAWAGDPPRLSRLEYETAEGEAYRWSFAGFESLRAPEEGRFVLEPPPGTEVVDLTAPRR